MVGTFACAAGVSAIYQRDIRLLMWEGGAYNVVVGNKFRVIVGQETYARLMGLADGDIATLEHAEPKAPSSPTVCMGEPLAAVCEF